MKFRHISNNKNIKNINIKIKYSFKLITMRNLLLKMLFYFFIISIQAIQIVSEDNNILITTNRIIEDYIINELKAMCSCSVTKVIKLNLKLEFSYKAENIKFSGKAYITKIDFSNFDSSGITNMELMFDQCQSLSSIIFGNFDTSSVVEMNHMLCGCRSLTSLDLSCFDTSKVTNMEYLFINCISLQYLNVSSFKTSNVENMKGMFQNCTSLTSLNLSNFDTSKVTIFNSMFRDSEKLKIIDFKNAVINNNAYTENAFKNLSSGVKICIDEESLLLKSVTSSLNCFFYISCDDKEYDVPGKFIDQLDNNICTYNCTNLRKYFIESDNICYKPTQDTNLPYIKNISEILFIFLILRQIYQNKNLIIFYFSPKIK